MILERLHPEVVQFFAPAISKNAENVAEARRHGARIIVAQVIHTRASPRSAHTPARIGQQNQQMDAHSTPRIVDSEPANALFSPGDAANSSAYAYFECFVLCVQVGSLEEATEAAAAGVDAIIAQGSEAGGHGAPPPPN